MKSKLIIISIIFIIVLLIGGCKSKELELSETTTSAFFTTSLTTNTAVVETSTTKPSITITSNTTTITTVPPTTVITTTLPCRVKNGNWESIERTEGLMAGPILKFTVDNCQITSLTVSVFPIKEEWFLWWIDKSLEIQGNKFRYTVTGGTGEFILEGEFTSENTCTGTMKFTSGFFWVDFTVINNVTFTWTARPSS
jgi:hypothetical protein